MNRFRLFRRIGCALCVTAGSLAVAAGADKAEAHVGFDISPYYDADHNEIAIGGVTHSTTTNPVTGETGAATKFRIDNWDVFMYEFDHFAIPGYSDGLGVNNEPGTYTDLSTDPASTLVVPDGTNPTGFATTDVLFFQGVSSLMLWDDSLESFVTANNGASISVDDGSIVVDGAGVTNNEAFAGVGVGGFLSQVGSQGFHSHFSTQLNNPSLDGIYAFQVQAFLYGYDGVSVYDKNVASDPFWLVYNQNTDDELFDEAFHFLNGDEHHDHDDDHGLSAIPEPASASLLALGFGTLLLRRRRHANA